MRGGEPMAALRGPEGRWWGNPDLAQQLAITADQINRMDDILQQHRLRLVDLHAAVQKQELIMEPLVSADQPDETKLLAQIDKVAQARADLEKENARMLLDIRRVLTQDQWQKLKAVNPPRPAERQQGGPGGPPPRLKRQ
jgi:Spy/CpxP family protein refolding chaperone